MVKLEPIYGDPRPFADGDDHLFGPLCASDDCALCARGSTPVTAAVIPVSFLEAPDA